MTDIPADRRSPIEHEWDAGLHTLTDAAATLAERLDGPVRRAAQDLIDAYFRRAAAMIRLLDARAEAAERACAEWADVSQRNYQRAKAAEAELARLRASMADET